MFESVTEALNIIRTLGKKGITDSKEYRSAVVYLKSEGYIISGVGLTESSKIWDYRTLRSRIYTIRSLNNQSCNRCIDDELFKGWKISTINKEALQKIKLREGTDNYLF